MFAIHSLHIFATYKRHQAEMKTYDIYFSDQSSSDNKGFAIKSEEKAIRMAEDILAKGGSYIEEYAGGTISVIDSEGTTVWSKPIPER